MKFLKFITNNWQVKLLAIIVAAGLWIYAAAVKISIATFPTAIPIQTLNLTPGLVASLDNESVKINISADPTTWNKLSTESFTAFIDLNGYTSGTYQLPVNVTTSVSGVSIISRSPTRVTVTIENSQSKDIPVVAKVVGDAASDMIVGDVIFDPQIVKVSGPKSKIDLISQATAKIVLSGENSDFVKPVLIIAEDSNSAEIKNIYFTPPTVNANVKIVSAGNVKNVGIKIETSGTPTAGFFVSAISTNPSTISVNGAAAVLRNMTSISTNPIALDNLSHTTTTTATLNFPIGVKANITSISVTLTLSQQSLTRALTIPVKTKNLPAGLSVGSINPATIEVIFSGPSDAINSLSTDQITFTIDLSSAHTGSQNYAVTLDNFSVSASSVSVVNFTPQIISITLQ